MWQIHMHGRKKKVLSLYTRIPLKAYISLSPYYEALLSALQPAIICKPLQASKNNHVNMHSCRANRQNFNKCRVNTATI